MSRNRKAAALAATLLAGVLGLSACSPGSTPQPETDAPRPSTIIVHDVALLDGRTVTCVYESNASQRSGGPSCDWANAR